ncbi:hypothetical protein R1flu_025974 [Riccia fluitans]|uniref:Replitron HUH endonuclease domain-containing protein n=1 Tax=Riccia fluitans TaxID=41844 RepID=A0ABD1XEN3_9MARC
MKRRFNEVNSHQNVHENPTVKWTETQKQKPKAAAKDWKQMNENNPQMKRMNARRHLSDNKVQQANEDLPKIRKSRHVPEKVFDISLMIGVPGTNIDTEIFELLVSFVDQRVEMGVLALERGDAFLQLHVQGMMRLKTSSTRSLKAEIKSWIGWDYHGPIGGSICIKPLRNRGLHTVIGLIGYCLKYEGLDHFHFYSKNVSMSRKMKGEGFTISTALPSINIESS